MEKKVISLELETTGFDQVEQQTKSLKAQLREAQSEVAQLSEKFGATSAEAVKAAKRASELKDAIADAKDLTDSFNPDAKFNSLTRSIGGAMDGFSAFQGTLGLIGVESQDVEKMILKVQSAMALSQGLQGLMEAKDSFKQLGAVISDTFKGIKGALLASGIGAFVVLLGTVVSYWDEISEAVGFASAGQKAYNDTLEQYTAGAKEAIQATQKVGTAFELAKKGVISKEEALNTYNETLGDAFGKAENFAQAEKLYNDKADAYVEAMAKRARANALFELSAQKSAEALSVANEDNTTYLDQLKIGWSVVTEGAEKALKKTKKILKERGDEASKFKNKEAKEIEDLAKKELIGAEIKEKANGIKSESEIKLSNKKNELAKQNADKEKQYKKEAIDNIKALEAEYALYQKTEQEKEIFAVQEKYRKALEDAKKYGKDNSQLLLAQKNELNDIDAKYKQIQIERAEKTAEELKAIQEKANADYIQAQDDRFNLENEITLNEDEKKKLALQQAYEKQIEIAGDDEGLIKQATKKLQDDLTAIDEESARKKIALENDVKVAKIQMASEAINVIADFATMFLGKSEADAKKAFKINKAASMAQAIVSTYLGANAIFASAAANPKTVLFPAQPFIAAGISIASGLANVAKIARTQFEGSNNGGGGNNSTPPSSLNQTVTSSAPSFQIVGNAGANPLANLGGNPIKAYVVSQEVTTSQELDRNHIKNATFQ